MSDEILKNAEQAYKRAVANGQVRAGPSAPGLQRYSGSGDKGMTNAAKRLAPGQLRTESDDEAAREEAEVNVDLFERKSKEFVAAGMNLTDAWMKARGSCAAARERLSHRSARRAK